MTALHLVTDPAVDSADAELIESALKSVEGVTGVASIRSLGLTSVLYDERRADDSKLVAAVRSAGFEARVCRSEAAAPGATPSADH